MEKIWNFAARWEKAKKPLARIEPKALLFSGGPSEEAAQLFEQITANDEYVEFLTLPGYDRLARDLPEPTLA